MLLGAIALFAGAALPWAVILGKALWGSPTAVAWILWAALMVLAGGVVRWPVLAAVSGIAGGSTAIFLALWQTAKILSVCLSPQCLPGPGLGLVLAGGGAGVLYGLRLLRARAAA